MPESTEKSIASALEAIQNGLSQRKAAKRWGIPRSTLQKRLNGSQSRSDANEYLQRLSRQQESRLAEWVLVQSKLGLPLTRQQIQEFASRIVKEGGNDQPLGKRWIDGFLRRNPEIKTARGRPAV